MIKKYDERSTRCRFFFFFPEAALSDVTLSATLKMQCEATNAAYALYWKDVGGQALVANSNPRPNPDPDPRSDPSTEQPN